MREEEKVNITIFGQVIAKKNSQRVVRMGSRYAIRASKAYEKYAKTAIQQASAHKWKGEYPVIVEMFFYRQTKRQFDLDNMQGSILDILVNAGVIEDDSMLYVIPAIHKHGWQIEKDNPRTEIIIREYLSE